MQSYRPSKFSSFMDQFSLKEEENCNIGSLLDNQGLILFFKSDDDFFGCGEDGRMVFARMKHPDEDSPDGWAEEASFVAQNLSKMILGEPSQGVFGKKDLKKIKVVDKDDVVDKLRELANDSGKHLGTVQVIKINRMLPKNDRDDAPNFARTDEE